MDFLLLLILTFLGLQLISKSNFILLPSTFFFLFTLLQLIVFYLSYEYQFNEGVSLSTSQYKIIYNDQVFYIYLAQLVPSYLLTIGEHRKIRVHKILFKFDFKKLVPIAKTFILIDILFLIWFITQLNFSLIWHNNSYLLMGLAERIGIQNKFLDIFQKTLGINCMILAMIIPIINSNKRKTVFSVIAIVVFIIFGVVFKLGQNSRWAGLIFSSFLIPIYLTKGNKLKKVKALIVVIASLTLYSSAINGRGRETQGISQIPNNISLGLVQLPQIAQFTLMNVFAGANNLSIVMNDLNKSKFPIEYKLLSFSPLISKVDGFDEFKLKYEKRINKFVPFNFFSEVYSFGTIYFIFSISMILLTLNRLNKQVIKKPFIGFMISLPAVLFFFLMQQYNIRNCFRYLLVSLVLSYIVTRINLKKNN